MGAPMGNQNARKFRGAYSKERLMVRANNLAARKKKLYSNMAITSPMSKKEKLLSKRVANLYSNIFSIIRSKRNS
jgi:hypothetical protein